MKSQEGFRILALVAVLGISACAPAGSTPSTSGDGAAPFAAPQPTLVFIARGEPPSLAARPLVEFSGALATMERVFNAFLDYVDEREHPHPYLAEAIPQLNTDTWKVFPDGRMETTYRLKPGLTWQDGQAFSAEDFVFAWRVYANPELGGTTTPPVGAMEELSAPDNRTLVIRWKQPYQEADLLGANFQALPRHILDAPYRTMDPDAFSAHAFWTTEYLGLGPYRLTRWEPGAFIEADAFDGHVLGRPRIDRVRILFMADGNTAMANLLSGEAHFVAEFVLTATDGNTLEQQWAANREGVVLYSAVNARLVLIQMRPDHADPSALGDVRVRRALAHAIDTPSAANVLNYGKAVLTSTLTSPLVPYYQEIDRVISKYPYDPRRAAQLLQEAGFAKSADGLYARDGRTLNPGIWSSSGAKNEEEAAVFVDSLKRAGVDARQQIFSVAELGNPEARALIPGLSIRGGAAAYSWMTTAQIGNPQNRWRGNNRNGFSSAEYDRLFDSFNATLERPERQRLIAQMERVFTEQLPAIPTYFQPNATAHVAALKGPTAAATPDAGGGRLNIHLWEWRQ